MNRYKWIAQTIGLITSLFFITNARAVDDYTVELYEIYCHACHSASSSGAPQTFDRSAWEKVLKKGKYQVIENAVMGTGNMPPSGSCMECSYEDLEDLVDYMAGSAE